jgi:hypothetical protein
MVQALHYKPEGHRFDSPWCHNFLFRLHYGPTVDSASNRNEYQEYMVQRADNLTTFMFWMSWNLAVSTSWSPQGLSRPVHGWLYLLLKYHKHNHTNSKLITMLTEDGGSLSWLKPQYPLMRLLCSIIWKATTSSFNILRFQCIVSLLITNYPNTHTGQ